MCLIFVRDIYVNAKYCIQTKGIIKTPEKFLHNDNNNNLKDRTLFRIIFQRFFLKIYITRKIPFSLALNSRFVLVAII